MMIDNPGHESRKRIADYLPLMRAADGLTLSQVCAISGLEPSTIQNWIKRGYVPHPVAKKYRERHLARILLIAQLRESMQIDRVGALLAYLNGDADDESDDIIAEESLYDLFCEITGRLEEAPAGRQIGKTVRDTVPREYGDYEKLCKALEIMAHTYLANLSKHQAEELFDKYVLNTKEEDYGKQSD